MATQTFGDRLRQLREAAGFTQQELADRAGMHKHGVAKIERDERQPAWGTVQALAAALGLDCKAFDGTVEPTGQKTPGKRGRPAKAKPAEPVADEPVSEAQAEPEPQPEQKPRKRKKE